MCFSIATVLPFLLMGDSTTLSFSILSFFADDLVTSLLTLASTAIDGEGKISLLPFEPVALVHGFSTDFGADLGETSLFGE